MFNLLASLAEFEERELIRERTQAGLSAARARGRVGGRPRGIPAQAEATAMAAETLYRERRLGVNNIAEKLHISQSTLYSYLRHRGVEVGNHRIRFARSVPDLARLTQPSLRRLEHGSGVDMAIGAGRSADRDIVVAIAFRAVHLAQQATARCGSGSGLAPSYAGIAVLDKVCGMPDGHRPRIGPCNDEGPSVA